MWPACWRDRGLGGTIRFSQAAGAALAVGLVFAAVVALAGALFAQAGGTAFLERLARLQAEALQASGKTAEEIAAMDSTLRAQYSPGLFGWAMFRSLLPIVLVISLVAAAFVRKRV